VSRPKTAALPVVILLVLCGAVTGVAQEHEMILGEIERAKSSYQAQRFLSTIEILQEVIGKINAMLVEEITQVFPKSFGGWETSGPRVTSADAAAICLTQHFYKEDFPDHIEVEVRLKSPAAPNLRMWLTNPRQMARSSEGASIVKVAGRRCIQRINTLDKFAELMFLFGVDTVVRIRGFNLENEKEIEKFPVKMDLAKLDEMFN
jgi:hypothetical protein